MGEGGGAERLSQPIRMKYCNEGEGERTIGELIENFLSHISPW